MNVFMSGKKNCHFSVFIKLELYNPKNLMESRIISGEWGTVNLEKFQFFLIKLKKNKKMGTESRFYQR